MNKLQEKLDFLLDKYSVSLKVEFKGEGIVINGKEMPLFPWRAERRFMEFKNLVDTGATKGISTMRVCHIDRCGKDLFDILYREIDICEWVLNSKIAEIFAIKNDKAMNIIAKTDKGYICSFELAATLDKDAEVIDKHEIIAEKGVICDRAVDTQIPQSSIYVLKSNGENITFTDVDAELYGMDQKDCAKIRNAFDIAKGNLDYQDNGIHLEAIVAAARKSAETLRNIIL